MQKSGVSTDSFLIQRWTIFESKCSAHRREAKCSLFDVFDLFDPAELPWFSMSSVLSSAIPLIILINHALLHTINCGFRGEIKIPNAVITLAFRNNWGFKDGNHREENPSRHGKAFHNRRKTFSFQTANEAYRKTILIILHIHTESETFLPILLTRFGDCN